MKKFIVVILILSVWYGVYPIKQAQAACVMDLLFEVTNGGVKSSLRGNTTVKVESGNQYAVRYSLQGCGVPSSGRTYRLTVNYNGTVTELRSGSVTSSTQDINQTISLGTANAGDVASYTLNLYEQIGGRVVLEPENVGITFIAGAGSPSPVPEPPGQTPPIGANYTPIEVKVCELGSTTAKICWKTVSPSNSEIVYVKATENLNPDKNPPDKKGSTFTNTDNHFLNLTGLTAATKYKYVVRSSPDANTTSTKSAEYTFTTKNADGTGGNTGGTVPGGVGGEVKFENFTDFDKPIGFLFNPLIDGMTRPESILIRIVNIALMLVGIAAVVFIILGGFLMVTSAGNESRLKQGKQTLIYAIAGLILSLLSFSIVAIIQSIIS